MRDRQVDKYRAGRVGRGVWQWVLALAVICGCGTAKLPGHEKNLLLGVSPEVSSGVVHAGRLTDGEVPVEGDDWLTSLSTVFERSRAEVVFDLGRERDLRAAMLVADNNDRFELSASTDGKRYHSAWKINGAPQPGMRERHSADLAIRGRYVRLRAFGGDRSISVGELLVFEDIPKVFPPEMVRLRGGHPEAEAIAVAWLFFLCLVLFAALSEARLRGVYIALRWACLAGAAGCLVYLGVQQWPPPDSVMRVLRAVIALSALAIILRGAIRHGQSHHGALRAGLILCAFAALACFYNFFAPQFKYVEEGRKTYVHTWDMRVYYPIAKYFDALGFDGLYFASVAAYRSHGPGLPDSRLSSVHLRDLRTNLMTTGDKVKDAIDAAPKRFAPGDYDRFAKDMSFFWKTMGGGYLASLRDHGGNATPAWFWLTHWMFKYTEAGEGVLLAAAAIDPLLMLLFAAAVWRSFGPTTALLCLIIFGTTEFPQFGSNWSGSTLRVDWMVAAGLGACALRTRRDKSAGVLLAVAGLIRAFPAMCAIVGCLALILPEFKSSGLDVRVSLRRFKTVALSGLCTVALAAVLAGGTFGFDASWGRWFEKISMHTGEPNVNHVGLRTVLATDLDNTPRKLAARGDAAAWGSWQQRQLDTFASRKPVFYGLVILFLAMAALAAWRNRPEQAAVMGLLLVPVLFYPANYYMHGIFILPLMAMEGSSGTRFERGRHVAPVLLLWCALQYFSYVNTNTAERFYIQSVQLLIATALLILPMCLGKSGNANSRNGTLRLNT